MTTGGQLPVVVGIDGSEESMKALAYAVAEARRHDCKLVLAHAVPEVVPMTPMLPLVGSETLEETGRRILRVAHRSADQLAERSLDIEETMRIGSRVHFMVQLSDQARTVVLGHRRRSAVQRVLTASTTSGVALRAHCPVVCVPADWEPTSPHSCVLVGVEDVDHPGEPLETAFSTAARRRSRLTVLHAWKLPSPYDDIITARTHGEEWQREASRRLEQSMADLRLRYPEVHVEADIRHEPPAAALVEASARADLMLVGRHSRGAPLGFYLGSVTRTLIRETHCPVEVVPIHHAAEGEDAATLRLTTTGS
ncbi:universal stress protein [Nocardioides mesophilus]|uniref:Universal stress protein n=1 Tax=Nocardioides mesophilus TaxID=433659 RepID=A0A7G9RB57_9ACTN|nr:universal stress protein [Nocardioides mesophilus]QNN52832.1 universal stress protein [Nocardioides mesophilus]